MLRRSIQVTGCYGDAAELWQAASAGPCDKLLRGAPMKGTLRTPLWMHTWGALTDMCRLSFGRR